LNLTTIHEAKQRDTINLWMLHTAKPSTTPANINVIKSDCSTMLCRHQSFYDDTFSMLITHAGGLKIHQLTTITTPWLENCLLLSAYVTDASKT